MKGNKDKEAFRRSKEWKDFRKRLLLERGTYCACCGKKTKFLDLHHMDEEHYTDLDPDGFVNAPHKYANMCIGEEIYRDVEKVTITSLDDLPATGEYAVEFNRGCTRHFVVCTKGKVVFDPWEGSETVKYGKPTSYRKFIKFKK